MRVREVAYVDPSGAGSFWGQGGGGKGWVSVPGWGLGAGGRGEGVTTSFPQNGRRSARII